MSVTTSNPVTVLVPDDERHYDDDARHYELVRHNLRRAGLRNPMVAVHSGDAALEHVRVSAAAGPHLILPASNVPGEIDGSDALRQVKGAASMRKMPVIMLTTIDDPREMVRCYDRGCNVYVTKPMDPTWSVEAIRRTGRFIEIVSVAPSSAEAPPSAEAPRSAKAPPSAKAPHSAKATA